MCRPYRWLVAIGMLMSCVVQARTTAFVSVSSPTQGRAIRIVDVQSMTVVGSITGVGDEPSRMVADADRTRIYLSSWVASVGSRVYAIDTATRSVVGFAPAGNAQNRAIAISPDGLRVYAFRREGASPNLTTAVLVLDALTLAEIASVPITGTNCATSLRDIVVMPDGRIVANACTDGLRIIDPVTFAVELGGSLPSTASRLLGVSPDGLEVYVGTGSNTIGVFGTTGLRAINVNTGEGNSVTWNVPPAGSYPAFASDSVPTRMTVVPVPGLPPDQTLYFFSYFAASASNVPLVWTRAASLSGAIANAPSA